MQNRKMAGRFAVLPFEVIDILEELKPSAERLYVSLVRHHVIQEDWELPGEWVQGTLRATKTDVIRESHIGSGTKNAL